MVSKLNKFFKLVGEGRRLNDRWIILTHLSKAPLYFLKRKLGKTYSHKLSGNVTLKNRDGIFFCGNNMLTVWAGSSFYELESRPYFDLGEGVFIDIGANIGKFSIILGRRSREKIKVISIEPHPKNFKILTKNIELNKLDNVVVVNAACSDSKGYLDLYLDEADTGGHSIIKGDNFPKMGVRSIRVKTEKLDNIVKRQKIEKVNLIKVDVEGAEATVLMGAKKILKKSHPKIIFEAWNKEKLEKVKKVLKPFKYEFKEIDPENFLAY